MRYMDIHNQNCIAFRIVLPGNLMASFEIGKLSIERSTFSSSFAATVKPCYNALHCTVMRLARSWISITLHAIPDQPVDGMCKEFGR